MACRFGVGGVGEVRMDEERLREKETEFVRIDDFFKKCVGKGKREVEGRRLGE